jgi:hypothetical protein
MDSQTQQKVKVVFVGGCSRSGSTLLGRLLSQIGGFFDAGETHHLWKRCFGRNEPCGCGRPFRDCPFWRGVVQDAFGGFDRVDAETFRSMRRRALRRYRKGALVRAFLPASVCRAELRAYAAIVGRLLSAVRRKAGARVIVDSSKSAHQGRVLAAADNVELHVVHIVRDSRAVAYSFLRRKTYPAAAGRRRYMPTMKAADSARLWRRENAALRALRAINPNYVLLRYEDLARRPQAALLRVVGKLGGSDLELRFLSGRQAELQTGHSLSGNPMRFENGILDIETDDEWRRRMRPRDRRIVTALTWRQLRRYGYPLLT